MYHIPTGKIYIGSLKNENTFYKYRTHSKVVKKMMLDRPQDWQRKVIKRFDSRYEWHEVVEYEQRVIRYIARWCGWKKLWNKGYFFHHVELIKGNNKPHAGRFKKGHKVNNGRKQSPDHIKARMRSRNIKGNNQHK